MRTQHLSVASVLFLLTMSPALAELHNDSPTQPIQGLVSELETTPPVYQYLLLDNSLYQTTLEIKGVRDLRPWRQRHPKVMHDLKKVRNGCAFSAPIINVLGSVAQIVGVFMGRLL